MMIESRIATRHSVTKPSLHLPLRAPTMLRAERNASEIYVGRIAHFSKIKSRIPFEGPQTRKRFAFRHYEANRIVLGKPMSEHLRYSMAYWHTMKGKGGDIFGFA